MINNNQRHGRVVRTLPRFREVPGSIHGPGTGHPEVYRSFPGYLQTIPEW
jgi:hypothetical protein